jgi:hypothetical protein
MSVKISPLSISNRRSLATRSCWSTSRLGGVAHAEHVMHAKVNTEAEQELAAIIGIRSIPTVMAFRDSVLVYSHRARPDRPPKGRRQGSAAQRCSP